MIKSLIVKEIFQHWTSILLIVLLLGVGFVVVLSHGIMATDAGRPLDSLRTFLFTFLVLACLILGNRLVVGEYQAKTQLFLEALPLTRLGMIVTKYLMGLTIVLFAALTAFGIAAVLSSQIDDLTSRFLSILLSKTLSLSIFITRDRQTGLWIQR